MKQILLSLSLLFLSAYTNDQANTEKPTSEDILNETTTQTNNVNSDEQDSSNDYLDSNEADKINLTKFFLQDDSTAYFQGYGNEYASYTVHTKWLSDRYVALTENNGWAVILKIYRIADEQNKVDQIYNEIVDDSPSELQYPTIN
nr:hypothetical protein [Lysinibacillus timonensis]